MRKNIRVVVTDAVRHKEINTDLMAQALVLLVQDMAKKQRSGNAGQAEETKPTQQ